MQGLTIAHERLKDHPPRASDDLGGVQILRRQSAKHTELRALANVIANPDIVAVAADADQSLVGVVTAVVWPSEAVEVFLDEEELWVIGGEAGGGAVVGPVWPT